MSQLKWFSSGKERGQQGIELIDTLIGELKSDGKKDGLVKVLLTYREELAKREAAMPLILSRMHLDFSKVLRNDGIILTDKESDLFKEIMSLSHIRYGN